MRGPQSLLGYTAYRLGMLLFAMFSPFLIVLLQLAALAGFRLQVGNSFLQGPSHGGAYKSGNPRLVVVHSLECDANEGLAVGLNSGPGSYIWTDGVSPHTLSDPGTTRGACDTDIVGYHIGNGNPYALGAEVTGRAAWTRDQWLAANANKALERQAIALAQLAHAAGFTAADVRWLSLAEVADGHTRGVCTHNDISTAPWGFSIGTNHWDPGPGYPYEIQMTRIRYYFGCLDYWGEDVPTHTIPSDFPSQGTGGATPGTLDAASTSQINDAVIAGFLN